MRVEKEDMVIQILQFDQFSFQRCDCRQNLTIVLAKDIFILKDLLDKGVSVDEDKFVANSFSDV